MKSIISSFLGVIISLSSFFICIPNFYQNEDKVIANEMYESYDLDTLEDPEIFALYSSSKNVDTLFQTQYYQTYYFYNLGDNIGNNTKGSCGFVATGMLLSFFDTYWNDGTVPEKYEAKTTLINKNIDLHLQSPGIIQEPYAIAHADQETYHSSIELNGETYFHFKLMDLFQKNIRPFKYNEEKKTYNYGLNYFTYQSLYNYYLESYLGLAQKDYSLTGLNADNSIGATTGPDITSNDIRNDVINLVKQGIPVRLSIRAKKESDTGHCVIAYDYDADNDKLYCNFGWGSNTTHVTPEQEGYYYYASYNCIDLKTNHIHSNNYKYTDNYGSEASVCPCSLVIPTSITSEGIYSLDVCPTFIWNSFINDKWFQNIGLYHEFSILDSNRHVVFKKTHINDNRYTLSIDEWKKAIDIAGENYYVYIGLASDVDPYWDDYYYSQLFAEPTEYANKLQVKPSQWGFINRYWFESEGIKTSTLALDGLNITTSRLRCGYIEESYIILSPRRENAGKAYFEINFDNPVYAFMYGICLWSNSENLDGTAIIEVKDANGNWTQKVNILSDNVLKTRIQGLNRYIVQCPNGIYGIRFTATATAVGTYNKGRLCIDDLVFCTKPNDTQFVTTEYVKSPNTTTT